MSEIIQYTPSFFSGFDNEVHEFNSLEQLLEIPFVKNITKISLMGNGSKFYRFSYSTMSYASDESKRYALMAEYNEGYEWWVIGYINDKEIISKLPVWEEKRK